MLVLQSLKNLDRESSNQVLRNADEIVVLDKEEKMLRRQAVRDMQGTTEDQEIV